ncbi:MAG TPA: hypothetical protein DCZ23_06295 [Lachnospiraceae bacterium]|nr:hypothetical protein [Lachnospiraceae bacterium]
MNVILTTYQGAILGPVARLLGYILQALYALLSNFGIENTAICIILFTFIVNALMLPMQIKQQKFAKMSSIMNPELTEIQKKYKNKKDQASQQKMSLETQAVYQKYGVSPASGCLPMLITFPIIFALYRVIYNIPAYVPQIYDIYSGLAEKVQAAGVTVEQLSKMVTSNTYVVRDAVQAAKDSSNLSYFVDVLGQFNTSAWDKLVDICPSLESTILSVAEQSGHINSFLGLNIADTPAVKSISIIIPILSVITQIASFKISMAGNTQATDPDNPAAASMKMMNNVMPVMTGLMCFMFPIGVGIYWVAGNVFRIFQSLGINMYFGRMDMDAEVAKNIEKTKKRYEKLGVDPNTAMKDIAKKRTSSIQSGAAADGNKKDNNSISKNVNSVKLSKNSYRTGGNKKYKEGSIASYANMMARDNPGDKK